MELTEEEVDDTANDEELDLPVIDTFEDMQELLDQLLVLTNDDSVAAMGTILQIPDINERIESSAYLTEIKDDTNFEEVPEFDIQEFFESRRDYGG